MFTNPSVWARIGAAGTLAVLLAAALPVPAASSLADRLNEKYLAGLQRGALKLRAEAHPAPRSGPFEDVRCVFHAHSNLSHDSRATPEQIVAAATAAGVRAVFMTEHPTPDRRWYTSGLRGEKNGVLFVPGAELSDGLILWKTDGREWTPDMKAREVLERIKPPAVAFIAHPEKRTTDADWDLPPYAGMEIYNSHANALASGFDKLLASVKGDGPLKLLTLLNTLKAYPQEAFASIFTEQRPILDRWDRLNEGTLQAGRHVVGIAANDSHQNVGISFEATEDGIQARDALGKVVGEIPKKKVPFLLLPAMKPGHTLLSHVFDPYEVSLRYVSTHVLARRADEDTLLDAVKHGRAYVAFDWMADPSGFRFWAVNGEAVDMGGETPVEDRPMLHAHTDMPCSLRLLRNGRELERVDGADLLYEARDPGVYRIEAWVHIGDEERPWIYSNPIYVVGQR